MFSHHVLAILELSVTPTVKTTLVNIYDLTLLLSILGWTPIICLEEAMRDGLLKLRVNFLTFWKENYYKLHRPKIQTPWLVSTTRPLTRNEVWKSFTESWLSGRTSSEAPGPFKPLRKWERERQHHDKMTKAPISRKGAGSTINHQVYYPTRYFVHNHCSYIFCTTVNSMR